MRRTIVVTILICTMLLAGCTVMRMDRGSIRTVANLDKDQYELTGEIEGSASVTTIFFFIPLDWKMKYGSFYNPAFLPWSNTQGFAGSMAIYDAIEKSGGADMIIAPRFETVITGFPPFYWKTTVTVKGKGIRITN